MLIERDTMFKIEIYTFSLLSLILWLTLLINDRNQISKSNSLKLQSVYTELIRHNSYLILVCKPVTSATYDKLDYL